MQLCMRPAAVASFQERMQDSRKRFQLVGGQQNARKGHFHEFVRRGGEQGPNLGCPLRRC